LAAEVVSPSASGRIRVDVSLLINGQRRTQVPVFFDVSYFQQVAVARRRLNPGETLTEEAVAAQRLTLDKGESYLPWKDVLGRKAKTALLPGQRVTEADVDVGGGGDETVLVKARDLVRLVARVGPCQVTVTGEALQDGKAGQIIRVRNVDSSKIISGRVLDSNVVEVSY